jgi:DNA-binding NarL/FixJ family response regulator
MTNRPIRLLCVDDHEFLIEGLRSRLALEPDLEFVGKLGSAERLVEEARRTKADIVLLDIEMPGPDSLEKLQELRTRLPDVRAIMFSAYIRDHYIDAAFKGGAWGYLSKSDDPDQVIEAVRKVMRGEFAFGAKVLERCQALPGHGRAVVRPTSKLDLLTPRELQILRMIGNGMSRSEISRAIHRSPKTVDNHRAALMEKLGIHDRVDLARFAISEGLAQV